MVTNDSISTEFHSLRVELAEASYPIRIGCDWLGRVGEEIRQIVADASHAMVIHDAAVGNSWAPIVARSMAETGFRVDPLAIPPGETSKSVEEIARLWQWMLDCRADRHSIVVAVGGGVVGDLAGFAAATYQRGIRLVQIPTTLLSQVDSSVGGKTGINLPAAKNMVGAFWQPAMVAIDTTTLSTLDERQFASGMAEVVKYGVIERADFFEWLETSAGPLSNRDGAALRHAILHSCTIKAAVVADDERETSGRRAILNYGHTFGHAIEATAGYGAWLHGEAVSLGMRMAGELAAARGMIQRDLVERQSRLLTSFGLPIRWPGADAEAMYAAMRSDKKNAHGHLRLILPTRLGQVVMVRDVSKEEVLRAIEAAR